MDDRPLVITADDVVLDEVLRIAAAAGVDVRHDREPGNRVAWRGAPVVLIDATLVTGAVAARLPRRSGVVVVTVDEPDGGLWEQCVRLGVDRTVVLRTDDQYLVDALSEASVGGPGGGRHIAVVGACGGAGASVLATAVAIAAHRAGCSVLLADCDRWGPGLDVLLGLETDGGVRWADLAAPAGRLPADALHRALPRLPVARGHVPVLCHDRVGSAEVSAEVVEVVLDSGRRAGDVTVIDLPRHPTPAADRVIEQADLTVVIAPADVRGCFAAGPLVARLADLGARTGLVVRGPSPGGLGADDVAEVLGIPLITSMRPQPGLAKDLESGRPPGLDPRSPLARAADRVLQASDVVGS